MSAVLSDHEVVAAWWRTNPGKEGDAKHVMAFAREIERITVERTNRRVIHLRKRWWPARLHGHYVQYRKYRASRWVALKMAWRLAKA